MEDVDWRAKIHFASGQDQLGDPTTFVIGKKKDGYSHGNHNYLNGGTDTKFDKLLDEKAGDIALNIDGQHFAFQGEILDKKDLVTYEQYSENVKPLWNRNGMEVNQKTWGTHMRNQAHRDSLTAALKAKQQADALARLDEQDARQNPHHQHVEN
jgi:hypothetical protein